MIEYFSPLAVEWLWWFKDHGSSISLGWGEDTGAWECSWITVGERHTASADTPSRAILTLAKQAVDWSTEDPMPGHRRSA